MENLPTHLKSEEIPVANLRAGDTIFIDGGLQTIGKSNIRFSDFLGTTLNGQRADKAIRVLFPKWFQGEIIKYQPQI